MTRKRRFSRAATVWSVILALMLYWAFYPLMPFEQLIEWLRSSQIVVCLILAIVCARSLYEILIARMPHQALQLVLGMEIFALFAAANGGWFLLWRMAGYPFWMVQSPVNGWTVWGMVVGGFMHLTAPRTVEGEFPRENWIRISFVIVVSAALAIYVLASPPDASGLADWLRPYLS